MHSRRRFAAMSAAGLTASCLPAEVAMRAPTSRQFPADFLWGTATSSYQIEGALTAEGRGQSIWDTFAADPAHIVDHSNAALACDSYRRYEQDAALIAGAGLKHYRFSIAWPCMQHRRRPRK